MKSCFMKNRFSTAAASAFAGALALMQLPVQAEVTPLPPPASVTIETPSASATVATRLPYGVADVVKLCKAQVSDDVVIAYIHNSGTIYNLSSSDIVYLKDQGCSQLVISTMLQQKGRAAEVAAQNPQAPAQYAAPQQGAPMYQQPSGTYVESAPVYSSGSSVYVIPYPPVSSAYYGDYYYPSYGYYGYGYPGLSFSFGFGGRGYSHYGGHYGGYY